MPRPNVLFLMSNEHNYRFFSHHRGDEPVETPHLGDIARSGIAFETTYSPYPVCAPSRKCMLTGATAPTCGA